MPEKEAEVFSYLGTRACGCVALVAVDEPVEWPEALPELAQEVMNILRAGG